MPRVARSLAGCSPQGTLAGADTSSGIQSIAVRPVLCPPLSSFIAQRSEPCHLDGRPGAKASSATAGWLPCSSCRTISPVAGASSIPLRKCPVATQQRGSSGAPNQRQPVAGARPKTAPALHHRSRGDRRPEPRRLLAASRIFNGSTRRSNPARSTVAPMTTFHPRAAPGTSPESATRKADPTEAPTGP